MDSKIISVQRLQLTIFQCLLNNHNVPDLSEYPSRFNFNWYSTRWFYVTRYHSPRKTVLMYSVFYFLSAAIQGNQQFNVFPCPASCLHTAGSENLTRAVAFEYTLHRHYVVSMREEIAGESLIDAPFSHFSLKNRSRRSQISMAVHDLIYCGARGIEGPSLYLMK